MGGRERGEKKEVKMGGGGGSASREGRGEKKRVEERREG